MIFDKKIGFERSWRRPRKKMNDQGIKYTQLREVGAPEEGNKNCVAFYSPCLLTREKDEMVYSILQKCVEKLKSIYY